MRSNSEKRAPASQQRIAYLDGIRGLAIATVVLCHWAGAYTSYGAGGYVGVPMFLVLSGFVITTVLWKGRNGYRSFLWKRARRLYPALLGLLLLGVLFAAVVSGSAVDGGTALRRAAIALAQGTAPWEALNFRSSKNIFGVTWSLSIEWYFYIVWAAILLALRRRHTDPRRLAVASVCIGLVLWIASIPMPDGLFYFGPFSNSGALLVGCALALWLISSPQEPRWWQSRFVPALCWGGIAGTGAWTLFAHPETEFGLIYRTVGLPLICAATALLIAWGRWTQAGLLTALLSNRSVTALGRVSYSLYLWHSIPLAILTGRSFGMGRSGLVVIGITTTVVLTACSYRWLEQPFMRARSAALSAPIDERLSSAERGGESTRDVRMGAEH